MERITYTLKRKNERGRMTVRYAWEFICHDHNSLVLMVERYGYKGESCSAWTIQRSEMAMKLSERLASKFTAPLDDAEMTRSRSELPPDTDIRETIRGWSVDSNQNMVLLTQRALTRFLMKGGTTFMTDIEENFRDADAVVSRYIVTATVREEVPPKETALAVVEPKVANWGAW